MGAPGTLIPTEAPSSHQNFGVDTRSNATAAESGFSSCRKIQTERLEHDIGDLYLPPREACEASFHAGEQKITGWNSHIEDALVYGTCTAKEPEFARELKVMSLEKCEPTLEDLSPNTTSHDFREEVLERNGLVRRGQVVDQCHADIYLSNEHSLVPFTGLQLSNISCSSSRKCSAEGLRAHLFILEHEGHKSSLNIPGEQNALVIDASDEAISNDQTAVGEIVDLYQDTENTLICCTDQSKPSKIHNVQIDPVLNGVAEIFWEDLQIGERIGIGMSLQN